MTAHFMPLQGTTQAPPAPPIPALPAQPGAATGGGTAPAIAGDAAQAAREATQEANPIFGMTLAMVVAIFIGFPLARAFARRMDRRGDAGAVRAADLQPQILQLQESLDAMAVELERISEAQRFQAKLMSERQQALPVEQKRA